MMRGLPTHCLILLDASLLVTASTAASFVGGRNPHANVVSSPSQRATAAGGGVPSMRSPVADITAASQITFSTKALSTSSASIAAVATNAVTAIFTQLRQNAKNLLLLLTVTLLFVTRSNPQTLLWPGAQTDKGCDSPLPDGDFGCPFIGVNLFAGKKSYGPFATAWKLGQKYGKIFKAYFAGFPVIFVSGADNIKSLLKNEFKGEGGIGTFLMGAENNFG